MDCGDIGQHSRLSQKQVRFPYAQRAARTVFALFALFAAGCSTSVPFDHPKVASTTIPMGDTTLARNATMRLPDDDGSSGFYLLADGTDALGARLRLIEQAEQSIDAQYFYLKADLAGSLFAAKLFNAADRGVRIRLLIDDIIAFNDTDMQMALLDRHPNIEVRLFNPIPRGGLIGLNFVASFQRANRRMHNKTFTVDNAITIVGGRNIGDAYFRISEGEFIDLDLLGFGPVAAEVSDTFDLFWNDDLAVPMEAFGVDPDEAAYAAARDRLEALLETEQSGVYGEAVNTRFLVDLMEDRIEATFASYKVVSDSPEKLQDRNEAERDAMAVEFTGVLDEAREEVIILTPYLVPGREGLAFLSGLVENGVRVTIITNSLASTDHIAVHSGYVTYRKRLLEAGVELRELKADSLAIAEAGSSKSDNRIALHTKAVVVDREILFVGSLNLDPRSFDINSEMGIFVYAPNGAARFAEELESVLPIFTYRLALDEAGDVVWTYEGGSKVVTNTSEPDAGIWRAVASDFLGIFPLEDQL